MFLEAKEALEHARGEASAAEPRVRAIADDLMRAAENRDAGDLGLARDQLAALAKPPTKAIKVLKAPLTYLGGEHNRVIDLLLIAIVAAVAAAIILAVIGIGSGGHGSPTATSPAAQKSLGRTASTAQAITPRPADGRDPKLSGCSPPAEDVPGTEVPLAGHGLAFGTLVLRHSPACDTAWGEVRGLGPEEKLRLVLVTNRPSDHATTSYSRVGGFNVEGVYGNELFQTHGCVRAIAVIEHHGTRLAKAVTPCR